MMSWRYRVIRRVDDNEVGYGIHEVFTLPDNDVTWTAEAVGPFGETLEELSDDLALMQRALSEPVLEEVEGESGEAVLVEVDDGHCVD